MARKSPNLRRRFSKRKRQAIEGVSVKASAVTTVELLPDELILMIASHATSFNSTAPPFWLPYVEASKVTASTLKGSLQDVFLPHAQHLGLVFLEGFLKNVSITLRADRLLGCTDPKDARWHFTFATERISYYEGGEVNRDFCMKYATRLNFIFPHRHNENSHRAVRAPYNMRLMHDALRLIGQCPRLEEVHIQHRKETSIPEADETPVVVIRKLPPISPRLMDAWIGVPILVTEMFMWLEIRRITREKGRSIKYSSSYRHVRYVAERK